MEKLKVYLEDKTAGDIAKQLGISQGHLSDLKTGRRKPSGKLIYDIAKITDGDIVLSDWYGPEEPK